MTSSLIASWQIDGGTVETMTGFILGAPKSLQMVTIAMKLKDAYSLLTNLSNILKSIDITLPREIRLVKAMVFPAVVYGYESWTIKKAEC